jgi:MinD-like ATPase involved in chromosome partitioning or flagellar assembly
MTDTAINYAYFAGVLEQRLRYLDYDLAAAGIIDHKNIDKVKEICNKIIADAESLARAYAQGK